jgi:hypothetical protein
MKKQRFVTMMILPLMILVLMACDTVYVPVTGSDRTVLLETPQPVLDAQATLVSGQSELMDLSHQSTVVSLNIDQAANAVAQTTIDANQRRLMELSIRGTEVKKDMDRAAATQQAFSKQTQVVLNSTSTAESQAATAAYSVYVIQVNQTAQAQGILDGQVAQTAQAVAAMTAYPLTATPYAGTQAALLMQQYDREQQSFVDRVAIPMIPFLAVLVLVLFVVGIVLAYRRFMPAPWSRRYLTERRNLQPGPLIIQGEVVPRKNPWLHRVNPSSQVDRTVSVEIADASEPLVAHWIAEAEYQAALKGLE